MIDQLSRTSARSVCVLAFASPAHRKMAGRLLHGYAPLRPLSCCVLLDAFRELYVSLLMRGKVCTVQPSGF